MSDVISIDVNNAPDALEPAVRSTRAQLLDAIERELMSLGPGYSDNILRLSEAFERITRSK